MELATRFPSDSHQESFHLHGILERYQRGGRWGRNGGDTRNVEPKGFSMKKLPQKWDFNEMLMVV